MGMALEYVVGCAFVSVVFLPAGPNWMPTMYFRVVHVSSFRACDVAL